jgi:hypothetical protein
MIYLSIFSGVLGLTLIGIGSFEYINSSTIDWGYYGWGTFNLISSIYSYSIYSSEAEKHSPKTDKHSSIDWGFWFSFFNLLIGISCFSGGVYLQYTTSSINWWLYIAGAFSILFFFLSDESDTKDKTVPETKEEVKGEKSWRKTTWNYLLIAFLLLGIINFYFYKTTGLESKLIWADIILGCILWYGWSDKCEECKNPWAISSIAKTTLDSFDRYETVTRKDETRDPKGNLISTTSRQEQVLVTRYLIREDFRCSCCGFQYSKEYIR